MSRLQKVRESDGQWTAGSFESRGDHGAEDSTEDWRPLILGCEPRSGHGLKDYCFGKSNAFLADFVKRISEDSASSTPTQIYLYGEPGVGKTNLLCALANELASSCLFNHVTDLEAEIARARRKGFLAECYSFVLSHEIILFDDVQYAARDSAFQSELSHLLEQLLLRQRTVILCSTVRPEHIENADPQLVSILMGGIVLKMEMLDEDERLRLLRGSYDSETLPDSVAAYLARNVKDNIRRLKAAAQQLIALSRQTATPITVEMARAIAPLPEDLCHRSTPPPPPPDGNEGRCSPYQGNRAAFFKEMFDAAKTEEEQILALQIALSQRLREARETNGGEVDIAKLESALRMLRDGKLEEALTRASDSMKRDERGPVVR